MEPNADHSQQLVNLAFVALDYAVENVIESGGPLIPLAFFEQDGQRRLERGVGDRLEDGLALLRTRAAGLDDAIAAIAFDGYITTGEGRFDAIHVEARDASGDTLRLAQRYQFKGLMRKRPVALGNPIVITDGA